MIQVKELTKKYGNKSVVEDVTDFGGSIVGNALYAGLGNGGKAVRTQTMVRYQSGLIDGSIFGAANGAYN